MKIYRLGYCTLASMLLLVSCQNDDANEEVQPIAIEASMLLTVEIENNHLVENESYTEREWIFISNSEGKVLQTQEVINGSTLEFERPDNFEEDHITATRLRLYERDDYRSLSMHTYTNIPPASWVLEENENISHTPLGEVEGSFVSATYDNFLMTPSRQYVRLMPAPISEDSVRVDFRAELYENNERLYVSVFEDQPRYLYTEIELGSTYNFTASDFNTMSVAKSVELPYVERASTSVYGTTKEGDWVWVSKSKWNEGTSSIPYYLPDYAFAELDYTFSASRGDGLSYYRRDTDNIPDSYSIPTVTYSVGNNQLSKFEASADYAHDFWTASSYDYNADEELTNVSLHVYGSESRDIRFSISLPEEITKEYPFIGSRIDNISLESLQLIDQDNVSSYEEYIATLYTRDAVQDRKMYESVSIQLDTDAENGRHATEQFPKHIQAEQKRHTKEHGHGRRW